MKKSITGRVKASVMSAVIAASTVPAYLMAAPVYAAAPAGSVIAANKTADVASVAVGKSTGKLTTVDYISTTDKFINITFTPDYTGNFSYGFGIGTKTSPYWYELDGETGKFIDTKDGTIDAAGTSVAVTEGTPVTISIDISGLDISYTPGSNQYPGQFEFRNYYAGEGDSTITISSITGSATSQATDPDDPVDPDDPDKKEDNVPDNNKHTNGKNSAKGQNWDVTINDDGTATITSTIAKQIDADALGDLVLTKGYDDDYYAANPSSDPDRPINSHKFTYSDFGLTDLLGVTVESLTVTIESDVDMDQFIYGGGLNVKKESPADTEYAKQLAGIKGKESAAYWYNDMGVEGDGSVAYFEELGVEFQITPGNGGSLNNAGSYFDAYWEVPAEVQPYTSQNPSDSVSFQYWWGNDVDGEEVESVKVVNAVLTYTKTVTVPYTDSILTAIDKTIDHTGTDEQKNLEIAYADLGIDETKDVYAVRFDIEAKSDIGKLIYNIGSSVDESVSEDYWLQEAGNYCILDAGDTAQIMWIVPAIAAGDNVSFSNGINEDGTLLIGYYYGETDAITIKNIEVYYSDTPTTTTTTTTTAATTTTTAAPTTTTTKATTTVTTTVPTTTSTEPATTTAALQPTLWGDANVDGKVSLADAVAVIQSIGNKDKYPLKPVGTLNADVYDNGDGVTAKDALTIQQVEAKLITQAELPVSYKK